MGFKMTDGPDSTTYAAFGGVVVIGGANFIAVSISNHELPPLFGAMLRFALAAMLFVLIARARRVPMARGRAAIGAAIYGLLAFGIAYALLYISLVGLSAGTTAVIVATAPLSTLVLAVFVGQEKLTWSGIVGSCLAVAGIAVLSFGAIGSAASQWYVVAAVSGTLAMAASSVVAKALPNVHPVSMNAIGMTAGAILLAIGSQVLDEAWTLPTQSATLVAVAWLVVLGSVGLFLLALHVIRRWTASAAAFATAGMPLIAAALGALLLDQPITREVVAGGAVVIAAVYLGAIYGRQNA